jgi:curved DNA-binding protein CbpA
MKAREAKKEYIRLAKKYHPDNRGGDAEMFKRVNNAYEEYKKNQEN